MAGVVEEARQTRAGVASRLPTTRGILVDYNQFTTLRDKFEGVGGRGEVEEEIEDAINVAEAPITPAAPKAKRILEQAPIPTGSQKESIAANKAKPKT
jgi:hypothetical protein